MNRLLLTADRLRTITADVMTERDLENTLRRHRIHFSWTTSPGFLAARIQTRSGPVLVYKTAARSGAMITRAAAPVRSAAPAGYPFPVPRFSWDD